MAQVHNVLYSNANENKWVTLLLKFKMEQLANKNGEAAPDLMREAEVDIDCMKGRKLRISAQYLETGKAIYWST